MRLIGRKLRQLTGRSEFRHLAATVGISGPLAGIVNNTPVVAVLIPTLVDLAKENRVSPSKLLIPLSYASMMGGMLTLIGTASTILASDLSARLIDHPIGMFEFTHLGGIVLATGLLYFLVVGRWLMPARDRVQVHDTDEESFIFEVRVQSGSSLVGKSVSGRPCQASVSAP